MWPKTAAPAGGTGAFPEQKSPSPGESGSRLLAGANTSVLARVLPCLLLQQKQRGSPGRRESPRTCPTASSRGELLWAGGVFTRSEGGHPHKGALCLCAPGWAAGTPGSAPGQGKAGAPARHPRPQPSSSIQRPPIPPGFKNEAPLGWPQPAPPKAGTRATGAEKFAGSPRCALKASRLQQGLSTPSPIPAPRRPDPPGWRRRGTPRLAHL